jgi:hypothetical protein
MDALKIKQRDQGIFSSQLTLINNFSVPIPETGPNMFNGRVQKLRACEICGSLLSKFDTDQRLLEGHFAGKLHIGYKEIREKFSELQVCF